VTTVSPTASDSRGTLSHVTLLPRVRATKAYDMAVRIFGSAWFLILAFAAGLKVLGAARTMSIADFTPAGWPALLASLSLFLFYLALGWLILHRPPPVAQSVGILPSLTAFLGTYFPWTIVLFAPGAASAGQDIASAALLLTGFALMVVVIYYLGRCFSIVPQARALVRTGPYAIVRHPLYFVEEVALLGTLLQVLSPVTLALFLVHGALQMRRMFYEEGILRHAFPEYDGYARTTARLIPYVW
jgi:hypothetical protein